MHMSKQIKISLFTSFLILILLASNFYVFYFNLDYSQKQQSNRQQQLKEEEWLYVYSIIDENINKGKIQVNFIANNIKKDLQTNYAGNMDKLKYDMINLSNDSIFQQTLSKNITGKYLNVDNDNNDIWVAFHDKIIFDKSLNCSKNGETRDWKTEISMHSNKELAANTINKIVMQTNDPIIFWEFLPSINKNHNKILTSNYDSLKEVFLKEGIEGLKTYEFLVPAYINDKDDIFQIPDVDNLGQKVTNNKIIITQGFNIYDQLMKEHKTEINKFNNIQQQELTKFEYQKQLLQIEIILISILMFAIFISAIKIQNLLLEENNN